VALGQQRIRGGTSETVRGTGHQDPAHGRTAPGARTVRARFPDTGIGAVRAAVRSLVTPPGDRTVVVSCSPTPT
jgi:hypothetical protein